MDGRDGFLRRAGGEAVSEAGEKMRLTVLRGEHRMGRLPRTTPKGQAAPLKGNVSR